MLCASARAIVINDLAGSQEDGGICTGADDELGSSCSASTAGTSSSDDMAPKQQSDTGYGVDQQTLYSQKRSTEDLNVQVTNYILSLLEHHIPTVAEALNDCELPLAATIIVCIIVARIMFVGVMLGILGGICCSVPIVLVAQDHCRLLAESLKIMTAAEIFWRQWMAMMQVKTTTLDQGAEFLTLGPGEVRSVFSRHQGDRRCQQQQAAALSK